MKPETKNILDTLHERFKELEPIREPLLEAFRCLNECYKISGKVLICGNGGSAADSEHIAGELMKGFVLKRPLPPEDSDKILSAFPDDEKAALLAKSLQGALPAIPLVNHTSLISAVSNDTSADMIYAQQVYGYGKPGDVLIAISTSGNAANVINAVKTAKAFGLKTIGLTGGTGGGLVPLCDITLIAPTAETYRIQEYHLPIYHTLCAMLEREWF